MSSHKDTFEFIIGCDEGVEFQNKKIKELIDGYYTRINIGTGDPTINCSYANVCRDLEQLIEVKQ